MFYAQIRYFIIPLYVTDYVWPFIFLCCIFYLYIYCTLYFPFIFYISRSTNDFSCFLWWSRLTIFEPDRWFKIEILNHILNHIKSWSLLSAKLLRIWYHVYHLTHSSNIKWTEIGNDHLCKIKLAYYFTVVFFFLLRAQKTNLIFRGASGGESV